MMTRTLTLALLLTLAQAAGADIITYHVTLDGAQETPPVATSATGSATVTFNTDTRLMTVSDGVFSGLTSNINNAHVHGYAAAGAGPAGVVFGLTFAGTTSGTFSGSGTIPVANVNDVLAGLTYINVHSVNFPGGEIRGQIIPEPAALALLAAGATPLLMRRRA